MAVDDKIARPFGGVDKRLHRRRRVLARERVDELDGGRLEVEVREVDPHAGGHRRDRSTTDRQSAEEPDLNREPILREQDPTPPAVGVLVLAPKLELTLELQPRDLRVDDDHYRLLAAGSGLRAQEQRDAVV